MYRDPAENQLEAGFAPERAMAKTRADVLTIDDLSAYLKVSKSTLYKLAQEGRVPGQKVGRHWRFHRATIDSWLANSPERGRSKRG